MKTPENYAEFRNAIIAYLVSCNVDVADKSPWDLIRLVPEEIILGLITRPLGEDVTSVTDFTREVRELYGESASPLSRAMREGDEWGSTRVRDWKEFIKAVGAYNDVAEAYASPSTRSRYGRAMGRSIDSAAPLHVSNLLVEQRNRVTDGDLSDTAWMSPSEFPARSEQAKLMERGLDSLTLPEFGLQDKVSDQHLLGVGLVRPQDMDNHKEAVEQNRAAKRAASEGRGSSNSAGQYGGLILRVPLTEVVQTSRRDRARFTTESERGSFLEMRSPSAGRFPCSPIKVTAWKGVTVPTRESTEPTMTLALQQLAFAHPVMFLDPTMCGKASYGVAFEELIGPLTIWSEPSSPVRRVALAGPFTLSPLWFAQNEGVDGVDEAQYGDLFYTSCVSSRVRQIASKFLSAPVSSQLGSREDNWWRFLTGMMEREDSGIRTIPSPILRRLHAANWQQWWHALSPQVGTYGMGAAQWEVTDPRTVNLLPSHGLKGYLWWSILDAVKARRYGGTPMPPSSETVDVGVPATDRALTLIREAYEGYAQASIGVATQLVDPYREALAYAMQEVNAAFAPIQQSQEENA